MAGKDNHLYHGFCCADKRWLTEGIWADLDWKEHIPALKEFLASRPACDQDDIDREHLYVEKRGRLYDIFERMSWERMSLKDTKERIRELRREVAEIDDMYLVGGGGTGLFLEGERGKVE